MFKKRFIAIFFILLSCKGYYLFKTPPNWWEFRKETVARVFSVIHQPETGFRYSFWVNNTRYEGGHNFYINVDMVVPGSKFLVAYNPSNPKQNKVLLHEPVFEKNEKVDFTVGQVGSKIEVIQCQLFEKEIISLKYRYVIEGKKYRAKNYIINTSNHKNENIENHRFKVKYWVEDPQRSVILLDEPVND